MSQDKYRTLCKLTCEGGSAAGTCPCRGPTDCVFRHAPGFAKARSSAVSRMMSVVNRVVAAVKVWKS